MYPAATDGLNCRLNEVSAVRVPIEALPSSQEMSTAPPAVAEEEEECLVSVGVGYGEEHNRTEEEDYRDQREEPPVLVCHACGGPC
jgi:hypothetical protein